MRIEMRVANAISGIESVGYGGWIGADDGESSDKREGRILRLVENERGRYKIISPACLKTSFLRTKPWIFIHLFFQQIFKQIYKNSLDVTH